MINLKRLNENIYGHKKKLEFILNAVKNYSKSEKKPYSEIKILDFGCGNGTAISYHIANLGVQLTGVDFHLESIEFALRNNRFSNAKFTYGNEDTVLELGQIFDIIIYSDVIEHLPKPELILKKIRNIHKDFGIIIITIPNGYGPFEIEKRILRFPGIVYLYGKILYFLYKIRLKFIKEVWQSPPILLPYNVNCRHIQFFTLKKFYHLMKKTGYEILGIHNGSFIGSPISEPLLGFDKFIKWNVRIADKLPRQLISTWYFVCKKSAI